MPKRILTTVLPFVAAAAIAAPAQTVTTFDPPGALDTFADAINSLGIICGDYSDATGNYHGFVRDAAGTITSFDAPHAVDTLANDINAAGRLRGILGMQTS